MRMNAVPLNSRRFHWKWMLGILLGILGTTSMAFAYPRLTARAAQEQTRQPARVLVKFRTGPSDGRRALAAAGLTPKSEISGIGVHVVPAFASQSAEDLVADLKARYGSDLAYAEVDRPRYAVLTPNDPGFSAQYHLTKISCPAAWDSTTGSGITIAIADTGVTPTHPDLAAHLLPGFNVVDGNTDVTDIQGHGTFVAGVAAAVGDNGIGVTGVAYNTSILPIRISTDTAGTSTDSDIAAAIVYAADHGAKVINISFNSDVPAPAGCWTQTVLSAADYMNNKGGLVVIAAGNAGINKGCPNNPEIIDVAATDQNDQLASFSNFGSEIDVSAPGVGIISTNCNTCIEGMGLGDYAQGDGTSFAAPITAGVLGLIYAIDSTFSAGQAQQILFDTAADLGTPGYDTSFGWGRVNAQNAVSTAAQRSVIFRLSSLSNVYAYPNPWDARKNTNRQVTIANIPDGATVKIFTLSGFWVKTLQASNGRGVWDLTNDAGSRVASGLYFYVVTTPTNSTKGEIAIIK